MATFNELYIMYQTGQYNSDHGISTTILDRFQRESMWDKWFVHRYGLKTVTKTYNAFSDDDMYWRLEILIAMRIYFDVVCNNARWTLKDSTGNTIVLFADGQDIEYAFTFTVNRIPIDDFKRNLNDIFDFMVKNNFKPVPEDLSKNIQINIC